MYHQQNVFETGITLPGRSDVSLEAATSCWQQLCAVLGNLTGKLSVAYIGLLLVRSWPFSQPYEFITDVLALLLSAL
jgi:hypothetical protein